MRFFSLLIFLNFVFAVPTFCQTTSPKNDFQIWNDTQSIIPLKKSKDKKSERVSLIFYGVLRAGKNQKNFIDERIGLGFEFRFNRYVTFTPSYLYRAEQLLNNKIAYESRLRFDVGFEKKFKDFSLKDRNRIEQRFRNSHADSTRYRNKFQLTIPVKNDNKEIFAPFAATEPYYEFQSKHWTRNELTLGIAKKFNPNFSAEFFYMLQNNRGKTLKYVNVAGINLKIKID